VSGPHTGWVNYHTLPMTPALHAVDDATWLLKSQFSIERARAFTFQPELLRSIARERKQIVQNHGSGYFRTTYGGQSAVAVVEFNVIFLRARYVSYLLTRSSADADCRGNARDAPQIRNIAFEKAGNSRMTFKDTQNHYNCCY